jgi:hypothetical protein
MVTLSEGAWRRKKWPDLSGREFRSAVTRSGVAAAGREALATPPAPFGTVFSGAG